MVHGPGKDRQGPAGAGGEGVMSCGDEWGRSSHTNTYNGASKSAACFWSQLSPNEQVLVPCSSCTCAPPHWKVSEQGNLHVVVSTCGVLQHDASGRGVAGGTSSTGRLGVNALAKGATAMENISAKGAAMTFLWQYTVRRNKTCRTRCSTPRGRSVLGLTYELIVC